MNIEWAFSDLNSYPTPWMPTFLIVNLVFCKRKFGGWFNQLLERSCIKEGRVIGGPELIV